MSHTILLVQPTENVESRTWSDYDSTLQCLKAVLKIYEEHLKKANPIGSIISYEATDMLKFLDRMKDISMLVLSRKTNTYLPKSRDWIKTELFGMLRQQLG